MQKPLLSRRNLRIFCIYHGLGPVLSSIVTQTLSLDFVSAVSPLQLPLYVLVATDAYTVRSLFDCIHKIMKLLPFPSAHLSVALLALHCTRAWANNIFNKTWNDIENDFDKAKDSFESEISKEVSKELDGVKGIIAQIPMGYSR